MDNDFQDDNEDLFDSQSRGSLMSVAAREARFIVQKDGSQFVVKILAGRPLLKGVANAYFEGIDPEPQTSMLLDYSNNTITIFPQYIGFSENLYKQKYTFLSEIQIDYDFTDDPPQYHEQVMDLMGGLPKGFIREPSYGLGLAMEMRPLVHSIEKLDGVRRLVISNHETTRFADRTFFLNAGEYRQLQTAMSRTTRSHQNESLAERRLLAYNASIHRAQPSKFPYKDREHKPGTVFKLLGGSNSSLVTLHKSDRVGMLRAVANNANTFASKDPQEFVQLQKDIEIVSLDRLIDLVKINIAKNSIEPVWQTLLELNPFILTMLFGQPIVLIQAGASVGGQTLTGAGTKISDFLVKNSITHNAALVELKRPLTPLLSNTEYRGGVLSPHKELSAAIVQVLDQRHKLITGIAMTKFNNPILDLDVTAVECIVVAGRSPKNDAEIRSFDLLRNSLKDVRIITFDEILERLQILRELLAGERYSPGASNEYGYSHSINELDDEGSAELKQ